MSLVLAKMTGNEHGTLFVCEKSLIQNVVAEIELVFGKKASYYVAHKDYNKRFNPAVKLEDYDFVITSKEVLTSEYKRNNLVETFIRKEGTEIEGTNLITDRIYYNNDVRRIKGGGFIFGKKWSMFIFDEMHKFLKIKSAQVSQALCCVESRCYLALSGTLFDAPEAQKILTFMLFIHNKDWPVTDKDTSDIINGKATYKGERFKGVNEFTVTKLSSEITEEIVHHQHIIPVNMNEIEQLIYTSFISIFKIILTRKEKAKQRNEKAKVKDYTSMILVLLLYIRQLLIDPIIPITTIYKKEIENDAENEMYDLIKEHFETHDIYNHFNTKESIISTRIRDAINLCFDPQNTKVVMFSSFRDTLDLIAYYMAKYHKDKEVYTIHSGMSGDERGELIKYLKTRDNYILLLTYDIGSVGLNLQDANTVLFLDYDYRPSSVSQGKGRVVRNGQKAEPNVYYLCSNTYLEIGILKKHIGKKERENEIKKGVIKTRVEKISTEEIHNLISMETAIDQAMKANMLNELRQV